MAYFIGMSLGQPLQISSDTEGGGAPTTDVYVAIGAGGQPPNGMSRTMLRSLLQVIENYITSDDPHNGGANVLSTLSS